MFSTGTLSLWSEGDDLEDPKAEVFYKPKGAIVSFECGDLEPNKLYEFRVACCNDQGMSELSIPSIRAKTKKDSVPGVGRPPVLKEAKSASVVLLLDTPFSGGGPIEYFNIDIRECTEGSIKTRQFKFIDGNKECKLTGLKQSGLLQFRVRAVNKIGVF
jgi:hypothetical protein